MTSIAEKPKSSPKAGPKRPQSASSAGSASSASGSASARLTHQSSTGSLLGNMRSSRDRDIMNFVPSAAECSYAACFCEENVWKLCDHVRNTANEELAKSFVIFVSNKKQVRTKSLTGYDTCNQQVCSNFLISLDEKPLRFWSYPKETKTSQNWSKNQIQNCSQKLPKFDLNLHTK